MTGVAEDLAGLLAKATALPWRGMPSDDYQIEASAYPRSYTHSFKGDDTGSALAVFGNRPADFGEANRDLAVAAVNALPHLLSEIERLTAERDAARASLGAMQNTAITLRANLAAAREALRNIADEAGRENGSWVHLKRCIAVQSRKAFSTGNQEGGA